MHNLLLVLILVAKIHPLGFLFEERVEQLYADKYLQAQPKIEKAAVKEYKTAKRQAAETVTFPSRAYYSIDTKTNQVLLNKNEEERLPVASLTKLMTAYIVLKEMPLDSEIKITTSYMRPGDATANLANGETLSVKDAIKALLINSSSEAATSLAIANAGSVDNFVVKMNERAKALSLTNTNYANPVGWDDKNNYSSAKDVANLARVLIRNNYFSEVTKLKYAQITTKEGRVINLENTNQLLGTNGFLGVKTGFTFIAGECLVSLNQTEDKEVLTAVIGSGNRFGETTQIINWIYTHYLW